MEKQMTTYSRLSTMEVESVAGCHAIKQAIWLREILQDLQAPLDTHMRILGENQGAFVNSANPGQHDRNTPSFVVTLFERRSMKEPSLFYTFQLLRTPPTC
jgi:hypothetical protein